MLRFGSNGDLIAAYLSGSYTDGTTGNRNLYFEGPVVYSYGYHFPMAVRTADLYIVNGDLYSSTTSNHQSLLFRSLENGERVQIPFSALHQLFSAKAPDLGLMTMTKTVREVYNLRLIDWEHDHYAPTGRRYESGDMITEHVLGGALFEYRGDYFVTGMDLSGAERNGMFFMTELSKEQMEKRGVPTTVEEAMVLLKPDEVLLAEELGLEVLRQGEFFFIADEVVNETLKGQKGLPIEKKYTILNADKDEHSHIASEGLQANGMQIVRGTIKHKTGEHRMLKLYEDGTKPKDRKWYVVYESQQGTSWKASGDVD